jgi:hypothetical protein
VYASNAGMSAGVIIPAADAYPANVLAADAYAANAADAYAANVLAARLCRSAPIHLSIWAPKRRDGKHACHDTCASINAFTPITIRVDSQLLPKVH